MRISHKFSMHATPSIYNNVTSDEHFQAARTIAANSHVLLKNSDNLLPYDFNGKKVAIFGTQADTPCVGGGGSGQVSPAWLPTPLLTVHAHVSGGSYGDLTDDVTYAGDDKSVEEMQELAKDADICLFFLGTSSSEGGDRDTLKLTNDRYVIDVAKKCAKSAAIVTTPGAVLTPWEDVVDAMIIHFMPGVASAFASMDVLAGDVNPSGKLPITMPMVENQEGMTESQYPGLDGGMNATYSEGWAFGYRYYHLHKESPRHWFGEGMSYSNFELSKATWDSDDNVSVVISNTGKVDGSEVPQLYLQPPEECDQPLWMLRGFEKVAVSAGESAEVSFVLEDVDLSVWDASGDADSHGWKKCQGEYTARIGFSSDINVEFDEDETNDKYVEVTRTI